MAQKSIEKMTSTLIKQMAQRDFQDITICELCEGANVARKTFYNHFKTKEEVLAVICRGIIDEYIENSELFHQESVADPEEKPLQLAESFFLINRQYHEVLSILDRQHLFYIYTQELQQRVINSPFILSLELIELVDPPLQPYVIPSYAASILQMYQVWALRGFQESPEEMAKIYLKIVHNMDLSPNS